MKSKEHQLNLCCSFCGKSQRDVRKLMAGPRAYICNECIKVCQNVISQGTRESPTAQILANTARKLALDLKRARRWVLMTQFLVTIRFERKLKNPLAVPRRICRCAIVLTKELERLPGVKKESSATAKRHHDDLCCSFCGKSQHEVLKLVAGPSVNICDACVNLFQDIIAMEDGRNHLQGFAQTAQSLALDIKSLPMIPATICDRANLLAVELKRLASGGTPRSKTSPVS